MRNRLCLILQFSMTGLADDKTRQVVLRTLKEMEMLLVGQRHCLWLKEVAPRKHNRLVPDHQCGPGRWVSTGMASHQEVKKGLWKEVDGGCRQPVRQRQRSVWQSARVSVRLRDSMPVMKQEWGWGGGWQDASALGALEWVIRPSFKETATPLQRGNWISRTRSCYD